MVGAVDKLEILMENMPLHTSQETMTNTKMPESRVGKSPPIIGSWLL